jgi:GntR family transcriptional regulator, uxu operon transcriptional repressor
VPIQAIDSDRLYRKIARQLSELIAAGEFLPGQRLPAERELARQLGVSRPSVREALIALEIEGRVEVRVGSGVFVAQHPAPVAAEPADEGEGPFELLRARSAVEGETAALAAREATDAEVAEIQAAVEALGRHPAGVPGGEDADRAFHLAIASATHNGPLLAVVQLLWDRGRGAIWKQMEKHFETPALRTATLESHRAVLEAIRAGDAAGARKAMRAHLARVAQEFKHGWGRANRPPPKGERARRPAPLAHEERP